MSLLRPFARRCVAWHAFDDGEDVPGTEDVARGHNKERRVKAAADADKQRAARGEPPMPR